MPLLDRFLTCPLLCNVVHNLRVEVVDISVVSQMQILLVPLVQKFIEILQLQYVDNVLDVWFAGPAVFGAVVEETAKLPQLRRLHGHWRCTCPSLCNDRCRVVQTSENCEGPAVAVLFNVVDVPVVQVDILASSSWTRSLTCPLCQRQWRCSQWRCLKFSSSPVFVDIPVVQHRRVRCFQHFWLWRR